MDGIVRKTQRCLRRHPNGFGKDESGEVATDVSVLPAAVAVILSSA